jgi:catechol 2,3-dioxygenase-like lactoylglutathione lyase family enzyme
MSTARRKPLSRRRFVSTLGAAGCLPLINGRALAQQSPLPLANLGLEHLDILVPDVAASARFYKQVFDAPLHEQPFRGSVRYFVLLGALPEDRQVGYIAIGAAGDRPTAIGHYCALAETYDRAGVGAILEAAGYPVSSGGGFGMIPDPDGIELQLFTLPAGLVTAAVPSPLEVEPNGLFAPQGLGNVLLTVSDMDRSLAYYRMVYGTGLEFPDSDNPDRVWLQLNNATRIGLETVAPGQTPRIARFGIKVAAYDHRRAVERLQQIGVEVLFESAADGLIRFRDPDGITLEVRAG